MSCKNEYTKEIEKQCKNCKQTKIRESNLILVKRDDGKCNVFDKRTMSFRLSNWYAATYDKGVFFDDITFLVGNDNIMISEDAYENINNDYLQKISDSLNFRGKYTSKQIEEAVWNCSICGRRIYGRGFQEVSNGVWRPCKEPYQCQICSPECGMRHTQNWQKIEEQISNQ